MKVEKIDLYESLQQVFWIALSFLAIGVIIKCCAVSTKTDFTDTLQSVVEEIVSDMSLSLCKEQSKMQSYIIEKAVLPEGEGSKMIFKLMTSLFPIQRYTIAERVQTVVNGEGEAVDTEFLEVMKLMTNSTFMSRNDLEGEDEMAIDDGTFGIEGEEECFVENPRDSYYEEDAAAVSTTVIANKEILNKVLMLEKQRDYSFMIKNFYIVDKYTYTTKQEFDVEKLLEKDLSIEIVEEKPQVLIYHTHASEAFADSRANESDDTVVGVGEVLAKTLEEDYGIQVIHDTTVYDMMGGSLDRSKAYDYSLKGVKKILKDNPSIKVMIDLHRNSGDRVVTTIEGKEVAPIMLFNGLSRNASGEITYLPNKNLTNNLAFSLQVQLQAMKEYPTLMKKIYLKQYRYNLHLMPRSLLVELGSVENTVEEAKNAMEPFAKVLHQVLSGNTTSIREP
ncbi:stage II sporulation protein P [Anaerosporobacter faecicola]|uniref:stage II sporulation protein P n=1 Tax=Anaerosporobacter faecicola TaxID=2718714 RepID=UPI001EE50AD8|nr:stage II sporulation protein P [Anaerosporobacter faecicola]